MIASVSGLNSITSAAAALAPSTAQSGAEMQDRFLKLLVAQLNNQDPMNPMDNAQMTSQMAQINTVTGIQKMQQSIELMTGQMQASQSLQGLQMIGREVLVNGDRLSSQVSGVSRGAFELASSAEQVHEIHSQSAGTVWTRSGRLLPPNHHKSHRAQQPLQPQQPFKARAAPKSSATVAHAAHMAAVAEAAAEGAEEEDTCSIYIYMAAVAEAAAEGAEEEDAYIAYI